MCGFLRIDISNFYRLISGITGLPGKNNLIIEFVLDCWMPKSVLKYLAPLLNGIGAKGGVT
jgi:hypothetical protein